MNITAALAHAAGRTNEFLTDLSTWLEIPTISTDSAFAGEVRRGATWLKDRLTKLGFTGELVEVEGHHPILLMKRIVDPKVKTVLIYGHGDVQPAESGTAWSVTEAFKPRVHNGRIYARGAMDDKGQVHVYVSAIESLLAVGELNCNIIFLIEHEEECGSGGLGKFLSDPANLEQIRADVVLISDTDMDEIGKPELTYGLRGLSYMEVKFTGPADDRHSGLYGGGIRNPLTVLSQVISELQDFDTGEILVPGFDDDIRPLEPWEMALLREFPADPEIVKTGAKVSALWDRSQHGVSLSEALWTKPTMDLHGWWGGYSGEGAKTIIPSSAQAKLSFRLTPSQDPERVFRCVRDHIKTLVPPGITAEVNYLHGGRGCLLDMTHPLITEGVAALEKGFGVKPKLARSGGSIPITLVFKNALGKPVLMFGWATSDGNIHGGDENLVVSNYEAGVRTVIHFFGGIANEAP